LSNPFYMINLKIAKTLFTIHLYPKKKRATIHELEGDSFSF